MTHTQAHVERVQAWADAKGLYNTDSPMVQFWKMMEEFAELGMAIEKDDYEQIKDGVGDVRVCLINVCRIAGTPFRERREKAYESTDKITWLLAQEIADIHGHIINGSTTFCVRELNLLLYKLGVIYGFTLEEADNHAWNQIKDRTGKTVGGEFVKDAK